MVREVEYCANRSLDFQKSEVSTGALVTQGGTPSLLEWGCQCQAIFSDPQKVRIVSLAQDGVVFLSFVFRGFAENTSIFRGQKTCHI